MKAVEGHFPSRFTKIGNRFLLLFSDILLQRNNRRKSVPGTAHMLILFGFLAVQLHMLELIIGSFLDASSFSILPGIVYGYCSAIGEVLVIGAFLGIVYGFYRRIFVHPKYLTNNFDSFLILTLIALILIAYLTTNSFQLYSGNISQNLHPYFIVSKQIANMLNLQAQPTGNLFWGYEGSFWVHLILLLFFLIYLPGSKHLHIIAAVVNVVLKPLEQEKPMRKTDFSVFDENPEATLGYGQIIDLNWKDVLGLYSCTECGRCEELCPASITGKSLSPKRLITDVKNELFRCGDDLLARKKGQNHPLTPQFVRKNSPITENAIWDCTTCRACEDICPVNIQHLDLLLEMRKHLVMMDAKFPPDLQPMFENMENLANPWGLSNAAHLNWWQELDIKLMADSPNTEYLYFVGCAASLDERGNHIASAIATILKKAGLDFAILGNEENCCGDPARRAGNDYVAQMLIEKNIEVLDRYSPRRIITGCPHCFNAFKNDYPEYGANYEVIHHTVLIEQLVQNGAITINPSKHGSITYHDACYLGRWNGIYKQPRTILKTVTESSVLEMSHHHDKGLCCGAGGAHLFMEEKVGVPIKSARFEEAALIDAETIATACPYCNLMLTDAALTNNVNITVKDIAEIVVDTIDLN